MQRPLANVQHIGSPTPLGQGRWLQLEYVTYKDNQNVERTWERCVRRKQSPSSTSVDAVDIHAILLTPEPELLLVVQYRPALERYCVEFPSGLIDANEDPVDAAIRELAEETGLVVDKSAVRMYGTPVSYEPGLTSSSCFVAQVTIHVNSETQKRTDAKLEPDEWSLQTISLPLSGLLQHLMDLVHSQNGALVLDSRVHAFASGLNSAHHFTLSGDAKP